MIFHPVPLYISEPLQQSRLTMIFLRLICVIWIHFTFIVFYFSLLWRFGFSSHWSSTFGEEDEKTKWLFDVPVQAGNVLFCFLFFFPGRGRSAAAQAPRWRGDGAAAGQRAQTAELRPKPRERNRLSSPDIHSFYLLLCFTCSRVFHSVGEENGDWRISC